MVDNMVATRFCEYDAFLQHIIRCGEFQTYQAFARAKTRNDRVCMCERDKIYVGQNLDRALRWNIL